jgi:hypothetical protein
VHAARRRANRLWQEAERARAAAHRAADLAGRRWEAAAAATATLAAAEATGDVSPELQRRWVACEIAFREARADTHRLERLADEMHRAAEDAAHTANLADEAAWARRPA